MNKTSSPIAEISRFLLGKLGVDRDDDSFIVHVQFMNTKQTLGAWGESKAVEYYRASGYRIVARNYRTPVGEIDLVCAKKRVLYIVEVKTRRTLTFGQPEEAVTPIKRERMQRCAAHFLEQEKRRRYRGVVFQVCALYRGRTKDFLRVYTDV